MTPKKADAPDPWIIAYGCAGIVLGLWVLGRRVIETVGEDIAEITPARYEKHTCQFPFAASNSSNLQLRFGENHKLLTQGFMKPNNLHI